MWKGLSQLLEGLNRTKRLVLPQVRQNSSYLTVFELEHWCFICLWTQTEISALPGSAACNSPSKSWGLCDHVSQFPIINLNVYIILLVLVSLQNPNIGIFTLTNRGLTAGRTQETTVSLNHQVSVASSYA